MERGGGGGGWLLVLIHGLVYAYIHSGRSVAGCCPMPPCVTLGTTEAMVTDFPREAMMFQQPYPFGIDPVCGSMLTVVRRERWGKGGRGGEFVIRITARMICLIDMAGGGEQTPLH